MHMAAQDGWNEYSRLVLEQLEDLSANIEALRSEMQGIKQELAAMKAREENYAELRVWKSKIDEVVSAPQLKVLVDEVQTLKDFKTKSMTMFMVVQTIMGVAMAWALEIF